MRDFLLHIGWLTLSMSLIILLVLLFYKAFGKRFSARGRYTVWTVIMLSLCVGTMLFKLPSPFMLEVALPSFNENAPDLPEYPSSSDEVITPVASAPPVAMPTEPSEVLDTAYPDERPAPILPVSPVFPEISEKANLLLDIPLILFIVWAVGSLSYFTVNLASYVVCTRKLSRSKRHSDAVSEAVFRATCRKYNIRRRLRIYICPEVGSPLLFGYARPTVLLPDIPLSENSLVGILAHELTHYRRGDVWIKLACLIAESLYWFNPLVHIAASRCNADMELSCDETILAGMDENVRRSYGSVMLDIVEHCSRKRSLLTTQFNPHTRAVKERFLNILDMTKKSRGRAVIIAALVLCATVGAVIGCSVKTDKNEDTPDAPFDDQTESTDNIAYDSLSDFLTDEQIALYKTAYDLFPLFNGQADSIDYLHLSLIDADFETITAYQVKIQEESARRSYQTQDHGTYRSAEGEYQNFAEFKNICLTVFTEEYFNSLNGTDGVVPNFIEHDGRLYYIDAAMGGSVGYAADQYPDTYELISRTDTEIRFNVVGYYKDSVGGDPIYMLSKYPQTITMVLDEDGWRFSTFADAGRLGPIGTRQSEKVLDSYFGKHSIAELADLSVIFQGEKILLGDWFAKNEMTPIKYSIIDLDGDRGREMVFGLAKGPNNENPNVGSLILHSENDVVYAQLLYIREFYDLKADGTFNRSGNVSDLGICRLDFSGDSYYNVYLAHRTGPDGGAAQSSEELSYNIGGNNASEAEFEAYLTEQNQKQYPVWYDLSNIFQATQWERR